MKALEMRTMGGARDSESRVAGYASSDSLYRTRSWTLPAPPTGRLGSRPIQLALVALAAIIMIVPVDSLNANPPKAAVATSGSVIPSVPGGADNPYQIPASSFPRADNLSTVGNYSWPSLTSGMIGATPTLWLLYTQKNSATSYSVIEQDGTYNATSAWDLVSNGTCSSGTVVCHHPIQWGVPVYVANVTSSVQGTVLVYGGGALIAAYATANVTYFAESVDGGTHWTAIGHTAGSYPSGTIASGTAVFTVRNGTNTVSMAQFALNCGTLTVPGSASNIQNSTPIAAPTGAFFGLVASSSSNHSILTYNMLGTHSLSGPKSHLQTFAPNSTSATFNEIGSTRLATPGGVPGQVAAAGVNNSVFALYTSSIEGRTVALTETSINGGLSWAGPYQAAPPLGAIQNPALAVSPFSVVYGSWMSDGNGSWDIEQAEFSADGRLIGAPTEVPGTGGFSNQSVSAFSATVDPTGRPYYVWLTPVVGGNQLRFNGADLTPKAAIHLLAVSVSSLAVLDYLYGSLGGLATIQGQLSVTSSDLSGGRSGDIAAATEVEDDLYPEFTSAALTMLCPQKADPLPACGLLTPASNAQLISKISGPEAPSGYLGRETAWLLQSLGVGIQYPALAPTLQLTGSSGSCNLQPLVFVSGTHPVLTPGAPIPNGWKTWIANSTGGNTISAFSHVINPTAANLTIAYQFPSAAPAITAVCDGCHSTGGYYNVTCTQIQPISYKLTVGVGGAPKSGPTATFRGKSPDVTVFLLNLTPSSVAFWSVNVSATMQTTTTWQVQQAETCPSAHAKTASAPSQAMGAFYGYVNTSLALTGFQVNSTSSITQLSVSWNNSIPAESWLNATPGAGGPFSNLNRVNAESYLLTSVGSGHYSLAAASLSAAGRIPIGSSPNVSESGTPTASPESASYSYAFCNYGTNPITVTGINVTNISSSNASLSWYSTRKTNGTVSLFEYGPNATTVLYWVEPALLSNGSWKTSVELNGLEPFSTYSFQILSNLTTCGITYNSYGAWRTFATPSIFWLGAFDQPYDSITQQGGAASLLMFLPTTFVQATTFDNGTVTYNPSAQPSNLTIIPLSNLTLQVPYYTNPTYRSLVQEYTFNLTLPAPNTNYTVGMELNFTYKGTHQLTRATAATLAFVHLKDTSGDGLSDAEKTFGWWVTTQNVYGGSSQTLVRANPNRWATNGLVNDFVEKEFGLNPSTVDTAVSHTLDTWNLTFNLGAVGGSPLAPGTANFRYWNENNSLNPFAACPYPGASRCTGFLAGQNLTNLSQAGDSSPYAASVLWASSQLANFDNLSGVLNASWLRAVYGTYDGIRTLTVWGKLSWGANPLATSTPQDGVADGARVNPLYDEDLQLNFQEYGVAYCGNLLANVGAALQLHISGAIGGYGGNNYTAPINLSQCPGGTGGTSYELTLPVDNTVGSEVVKIGFIANVSTNRSRGAPQILPVNGCKAQYNVTVRMFNSTPETNGHGGGAIILSGNPSGSCSAFTYGGVRTNLSFGASEVPAGLKVPTYLWVPNDNSTLSTAPWGLKRYDGEQSFDMVLVNDADAGSRVRSDLVPTPWGGAGYYVNATSGMTEFLIPRGQFLNSSFGEAVLLNKSLPHSNVPGNGPLLGSSEAGAVVNNSHPATLRDLSCYWQNRSVWRQPWLCSRGQVGTLSNSSAAVEVADTSSCTSSNCGGVPSNPGVESSTYAGAALQFVATVNVSSAFGSTTSELDSVIAALVDNASDGLNGTFVNITTSVPSLGLAPSVVSSMANIVQSSGGNFGVPVSHAVAPQKPSGNGFIGLLVNTVSGIVYDLATGNWVGALWTVANSALAAIEFLAVAMAKIALTIANRTAVGLAVIGQAIAAIANAFLAWLEAQIRALLSPVLQPIADAVVSYASAVNSSFARCVLDYTANGSITSANVLAFFVSASSGIFEPIWIISGVILVALSIAAVLTGGAGLVALIVVQGLGSGLSALGNRGITGLSGINGYGPSLSGVTESLAGILGFSGLALPSDWSTFAQLLGERLGEAAFFVGVAKAIYDGDGGTTMAAAGAIALAGRSLIFALYFDEEHRAAPGAFILSIFTMLGSWYCVFLDHQDEEIGWVDGAAVAMTVGSAFLLA